ncbi:MAG: tripartite tricarboxylate transporter permease [Ectothiorhodospiraceae bacterium]|nr:tripartite tricarboxylate transporter permease [Ectothiorhodospiraceae bacterium]
MADGFLYTFGAYPLFLITLGTVLGITVGAIPGLTGAMLIALTLPFTFYMPPVEGICLLVSMYVGAISGGLITATLLRMPGTPASVMTTFDGYPMARSGRPGRALGLGITASFVGGLISWVFLATLSQPLSDFAVRFGPFEYFTLVLMALVLIASVTQGSMIKGLLSGFLGMLVAMPGVDPSAGDLRLTFGYHELDAGLNLLPVLIGVFAVGQVISDIVGIEERAEAVTMDRRGIFLSVRDWMRHGLNMVRSSLIGTWVGILPGVGANIGSIIAYSGAKTFSKHPERFGTGSEEGIIASESANNATVGGALIPLIAMGIPGSVIDAILLGALLIHSIQPGPLLFVNNPEVVYTMIATALVANVIMFAVMLGAVGQVARLRSVPRAFLMPIILVFCVIGSYALGNRMFDVWVMLFFGVVGYFLERSRVPLGPFVIGLVLAPIAEESLRSGLMLSAGSYAPLVTRPISAVFLALSVVLLVWPIWRHYRQHRGARRGSH